MDNYNNIDNNNNDNNNNNIVQQQTISTTTVSLNNSIGIINNYANTVDNNLLNNNVNNNNIISNSILDNNNNDNSLNSSSSCENNILDDIETLHLECLEYIELASPTNIYSYNHLHFDADLLLVASRNSLFSISALEDEKSRGLQWITKDLITPPQLSSSISPRLSSSPGNISSPPNEYIQQHQQQQQTYQQQTYQNQQQTFQQNQQNKQPQPLYKQMQQPQPQQQQQQQQQTQAQQQQGQQPGMPSQQMMKSHLQRLPLSHKSRIPPLPSKTPSGSLPISPIQQQQQQQQQQSQQQQQLQYLPTTSSTNSPYQLQSSMLPQPPLGSSKDQAGQGGNQAVGNQNISTSGGVNSSIIAKHPQQPQEDTIVSIDSLNEGGDQATIAIAIVSSQSASAKGYLSFHTYKSQCQNKTTTTTSSSSSTTINTPRIQTIQLDFIPFNITHTTVNNSSTSKSVFLLAGSDDRVHLYKLNESGQYVEGDTNQYFPELVNLQSNVMRIIIKYHLNYRIIVAGCQNGFLQLSVTDLESCYFDGPVQALCLYIDRGHLETSNQNSSLSKIKSFQSSLLNDLLLQMKEDNGGDQQSLTDKDAPFNHVHLAVGSIIGYVMVYRDILSNGLSEFQLLQDSDTFDGVTCLDCFDIDGDGENEILVGTYSMELLVYKLKPSPVVHSTINSNSSYYNSYHGYHTSPPTTTSTTATANTTIPTSPKSNQSSPTTAANTLTSPSSSTSSLPSQQTYHPTYQLISHKHFSHPILGILNCKLLKDGLNQTIIISMYGIYIMRTPIYKYEKDVKDKLDLISEILGLQKELASIK
ncbi:hypothetical protein PPL_08003 [Heterostelium album PN500]|uniref:Uncharacterized protein n=1 Tax=Heterostelium pallidum (strain ATCC 26659 / Pp 5 / PN500) TaxID=670386 RepID=D3BHK0_HETP5|nr:hypothetical protein PPL_08003 [Heterostelium album PN500]EFA79177.1 hypothetical protein PPL_08003 [Heterostelium album PN500]|eukprot:XP_020431298.1 hypothetical protein PPL_08003 [Heterostelium album PN500]